MERQHSFSGHSTVLVPLSLCCHALPYGSAAPQAAPVSKGCLYSLILANLPRTQIVLILMYNIIMWLYQPPSSKCPLGYAHLAICC
jgi:hypothetical protein